MNHCEVEEVYPPLGKILLVDDDIRDLEYHFNLLDEQGYRVVTCPSYALGARLLECDAFDLVVVSQDGLALEGRRVLERARQVVQHTPVLVLAKSVDIRCLPRGHAARRSRLSAEADESFRKGAGYYNLSAAHSSGRAWRCGLAPLVKYARASIRDPQPGGTCNSNCEHRKGGSGTVSELTPSVGLFLHSVSSATRRAVEPLQADSDTFSATNGASWKQRKSLV